MSQNQKFNIEMIIMINNWTILSLLEKIKILLPLPQEIIVLNEWNVNVYPI